jgi:biofilm PGA synthesis N-glycosyltransferase PgaC
MIASGLLVFFAVCLLIQLTYHLVFFSRLAFHKKKDGESTAATEGVTVVVCAHNAVENLKALLPILHAQDYPYFEVIVVNDRSTDETFPFLVKEKGKADNLKVLTIDETPSHIDPKKYAITLGIKAATHELILFTDSDCMPASNQWIKTMAAPFADTSVDIAIGYSPYKTRSGLLNLFIRYETLFTAIQYISFALAGSPYMGVGRNMAYRKHLFLDNKGFIGFQKTTGGDDDLFINKHATKANTRVRIGSDSIVYSIPKTTWKEYFSQKKRHLSVGRLYKLRDRLRLGALFLSQAGFWLSFVALLCFWHEPYFVIAGFVLRVLIQYVIYYKAAIKLGDKIKPWLLIPILDVLYVMYYIGTGISAVASRNIKWN